MISNPTVYLRNFAADNRWTRESLSDFVAAVRQMSKSNPRVSVSETRGQINMTFQGVASYSIGRRSVACPIPHKVADAREFARKIILG